MKYTSLVVILIALTSLVIAQPAGMDAGLGAPTLDDQQVASVPQASSNDETAEAAPAAEAKDVKTVNVDTVNVKTVTVGGVAIKVDGNGNAVRPVIRTVVVTRSHRHATRPENWYRNLEKFREGNTPAQELQWELFKQNKREHADLAGGYNKLFNRVKALEGKWWIGLFGLVGLLGLLSLRRHRAAAEPAAAPAPAEPEPAAAPEPEPAAPAAPAAVAAAAPPAAAEPPALAGAPPPPPDAV